jgi:hypothetical protein
LIILSLLKNEGIVLFVILLGTISLINFSKIKFLQNYKKIIFLFFSVIPILTWKIICFKNSINSDIVNYEATNALSNRIFDYKSFKLIFKFIIIDTKLLIFSIIFILMAFYFTKNKKVNHFSLSIGMTYLFFLVIIYLIIPYDLSWSLETTIKRATMPLVLSFSFFGLLQIYYKKEKYPYINK